MTSYALSYWKKPKIFEHLQQFLITSSGNPIVFIPRMSSENLLESAPVNPDQVFPFCVAEVFALVVASISIESIKYFPYALLYKIQSTNSISNILLLHC